MKSKIKLVFPALALSLFLTGCSGNKITAPQVPQKDVLHENFILLKNETKNENEKYLDVFPKEYMESNFKKAKEKSNQNSLALDDSYAIEDYVYHIDKNDKSEDKTSTLINYQVKSENQNDFGYPIVDNRNISLKFDFNENSLTKISGLIELFDFKRLKNDDLNKLDDSALDLPNDLLDDLTMMRLEEQHQLLQRDFDTILFNYLSSSDIRNDMEFQLLDLFEVASHYLYQIAANHSDELNKLQTVHETFSNNLKNLDVLDVQIKQVTPSDVLLTSKELNFYLKTNNENHLIFEIYK